jgi:hypothetical protein
VNEFQEIQAVREAMFDASRKTIVVVVTHRIDPRDGAECGNRAASLNAERPAGRIRVRLIEIPEYRKIQAVITV